MVAGIRSIPQFKGSLYLAKWDLARMRPSGKGALLSPPRVTAIRQALDTYILGDTDALARLTASASPSRFGQAAHSPSPLVVESPAEFGRLLREKRLERGLTPQALAEWLGIRPEYYKIIEAGRMEHLRSVYVQRLGRFFDIRANCLPFSGMILSDPQETVEDLLSRLASLGLSDKAASEYLGMDIQVVLDRISTGLRLPQNLWQRLTDKLHMRIIPPPESSMRLDTTNFAELYDRMHEYGEIWYMKDKEWVEQLGFVSKSSFSKLMKAPTFGSAATERLVEIFGWFDCHTLESLPPIKEVFYPDKQLADAIENQLRELRWSDDCLSKYLGTNNANIKHMLQRLREHDATHADPHDEDIFGALPLLARTCKTLKIPRMTLNVLPDQRFAPTDDAKKNFLMRLHAVFTTRARLRLPRKELARKAGVWPVTLARLEDILRNNDPDNDYNNPRLKPAFDNLCDTLNIKLDVFANEIFSPCVIEARCRQDTAEGKTMNQLWAEVSRQRLQRAKVSSAELCSTCGITPYMAYQITKSGEPYLDFNDPSVQRAIQKLGVYHPLLLQLALDAGMARTPHELAIWSGLKMADLLDLGLVWPYSNTVSQADFIMARQRLLIRELQAESLDQREKMHLLASGGNVETVKHLNPEMIHYLYSLGDSTSTAIHLYHNRDTVHLNRTREGYREASQRFSMEHGNWKSRTYERVSPLNDAQSLTPCHTPLFCDDREKLRQAWNYQAKLELAKTRGVKKAITPPFETTEPIPDLFEYPEWQAEDPIDFAPTEDAFVTPTNLAVGRIIPFVPISV